MLLKYSLQHCCSYSTSYTTGPGAGGGAGGGGGEDDQETEHAAGHGGQERHVTGGNTALHLNLNPHPPPHFPFLKGLGPFQCLNDNQRLYCICLQILKQV